MPFFQQSIELGEKSFNPDFDILLFDELLSLDLSAEGASPLTSEKEQDFIELLQCPHIGKPITNLAEYLLLT